MRKAIRYRGSILRGAAGAGCAARDASLIGLTLRLRDGAHLVDRRILQMLNSTRRPIDRDALDPVATPEAEVQPPIVLTRESRSAIDHTALGEIARFDDHLGTDGAVVAPGANELEADPVIRTVRRVSIEQ